MLSCIVTDIDGAESAPLYPLSMQVDIDEGVPADALYAVFPYHPIGELCTVRVYDGDTLVFSGVVDEQEREVSADGEYLKISARSLAAHLIDNEAAPCTYDHPSARLLYERYAGPYGIALGDEEDTVYFGEQNVLKGMSCWRVIKNFCAACYSGVPRVSADGVLYLKGIQKDRLIRFGNDGVRFISLSEVNKRCEEISAVYVKTENSGSYSLPVENKDAIRRGVSRVRYLNAALTESPMSCADAMVRSGEKKAYALRLRCPVCLLGAEGCRAEVAEDTTEKKENLYISAVRYRLRADGEYTDLTLKRRTG